MCWSGEYVAGLKRGSYGNFKGLLRCDRITFKLIADTLRPVLEKNDTIFRKAKTVEKRTAIGLWQFAHGGTYLLTGEKFGVSEALAHGTVRDFFAAVIQKHVVSFPTGGALLQVMSGLESCCQFANFFGVIDCAHMLISTPSISDYKGYSDRNRQ